ncbi:hypothetical protein [Streptomyces sp. NBC_00212]|uniref:hypothetical protein n=1 Tax=Streptomyces sp. NBC_00212 TaxID=2975684 RepID=UPI0032536E53
MGALSGAGWTEVVAPFASQREAEFERHHVDVVYERWAATQTALPMLVDADGDLADEEPGITNPAGLIASWHHRSQVAGATAGPTGGRMVVTQYEGLAQAARRADAHLADQDRYASAEDRALLLQVAAAADRYARRLEATLDVLARQRATERQESESAIRMREVGVLESAMAYLADQGADFRMDRRNTTITDREAAGAQLRGDLLRVLRQAAALPPERQNSDADARLSYANIRGIALYFGWDAPGTPQARAVLGFDELPLLERDSFTAAELEALTPTELIDRLDARLAPASLAAIRDRELAAIQDALVADASGTTVPPAPAAEQQDDAPPAEAQDQPGPDAEPVQSAPEPAAPGEPEAEPSPESATPEASGDGASAEQESREQRFQEAVDDLLSGAAESEGDSPGPGNDQESTPGTAPDDDPRIAVPAGYQPFSDSSVELVPGDVVREGWRQYMEDRHLQYRTVVVVEGPDPWDGYYICRRQNGNGNHRFHPREIVAVPDGSRLLEMRGAEAAAPTQGPEQEAPGLPAEAEPGAVLAAEEPGAAPAEPEQHTGPSPAMARCAAVLRYYEPLLQRHKLSGRDAVAFIDRPGVGFRYEPGNPLPDLIAEIGKVAERVGGSFRVSYHEWVNYEVGERRQQQSDTLTHLSIDLLTLYGGETEPLFTVDLEAILAAPPGTVIELPSEAQIAAEEAAAARIVIDHDAEGTEVRNTPRGGDQRIRDALNDLGFNWSRRQQKWYQRRNTPLEDRDTAVRGLRAAFDKLGVAYTYNGPDPDPQGAEETAEAAQQESAAPAGPEASEPGTEASPDGPTPEPPDADASSDGPAADGQTAPEGDGTEEPALPPAAVEPDVPAPAADTGTPQDEPEDAAADPETAPEPDPATIVQTPDGPGTVIGTDDGDLVLVTTELGTRVWETSEVAWPDGTARPESADRAAKGRQNAADAAQAATAEGIELNYGGGNRLVDLDVDAGHGTVVDADGAVIGWVRARIADDGRRYWWGQDARGGAPDGMPFHEALPPSAGVPAIRAAESVRSELHAATEPAHRGPVPAEYAAREVRLTTAQVRELRRLVLDATYSDGSPIEPPEWVASHRKYVLNTAQMQALGDAAQAAADAFPGATAEERRTARVLRNAAERFEFEVYDTARWQATIPPIGESDPYAGPYQPRPRAAAAPEAAPAPTPADTEAPAKAPAEPEPAAPADTNAPEESGEPDLAAAAHLVDPAPYWRIVGAETDDQATVRFGGPERMRAFAARVRVVPAPTALTGTSADVWMDGRMVGRIADINDVAELTAPDAAPLWNAEPVFGTTDRRLARFRSQEAAVAELAVRALRTGPPAADRLDADMTASFTEYLVRPGIGLPTLPKTADDASAARYEQLTAILDAFGQSRSHTGTIADDLATAHDSLLWLAAEPVLWLPTSPPDINVRDDLEARADTIATFLNVFRPEDPRAAQNRENNAQEALASDAVTPESSATAEEGQLDLFPAETPEPAVPVRRTSRRRSGGGKEPAVPPSGAGASDGRLGVYGHADHGECERCGTPDSDRYTVVWHWYGRDHGDMAAECSSCVQLATGLAYPEIARLADLAEARRDGLRIQPDPHRDGDDVTVRRTADNEWTSVHLPTGQRYRTAKETASSYRGYVTRDLHGVSHGVGPSISVARDVTRRTALGHTAETHPNNGDDLVFFGYRQEATAVLLHDGETITAHSTDPRMNGPYEHGPRWDLTVGGAAYLVEMVYQPGQPGDDGHRLAVTGLDGVSARYVHWDGVLEWAREQARDAEPDQARALTAASSAAPEEAQQGAAEAAAVPEDVDEAQQDSAPAPASKEPVETAAQDGAPAPDRMTGKDTDQEEAVADELTTDPTAAPAPEADPLSEVAADGPTGTGAGADVEDPPAPRRYTDVVPLPADTRYQLHLFGTDGQGPDSGELRSGDVRIATVNRAVDGRWFSLMAADGLIADETSLAATPQEAAVDGAVMFAVFTGASYGAPPAAIEASDPQAAADVLREELRAAAQLHRARIADAVGALDSRAQSARFQPLDEALARLGQAVADTHYAQQMDTHLQAVEQAVNAWGASLPDNPNNDERSRMAYPLAHLLYDTRRLSGRLQATLNAVQADRAAAREQEAAPAPTEPVRDDSAQQTPAPTPDPTPAPAPIDASSPELTADMTSTDQPAPLPDAPEDTEMATPARPATPESPAAPGADGAAEPGEEQGPADITQREGRVERSGLAAEPELPLWTGPAETSGPEEDRPVDVVADFAAVQEAWDEHVPSEKGTGADLFATLEGELQRLKALFADAVDELNPPAEAQPAPEAAPAPPAATAGSEPAAAPAPAAPAEPEKAEATRDPQQSAAAVNTALREADAHAPTLQDLPEWQRIQSVRGAFGHLMHVMKERAGEHFGKLMADGRVSDFVRRVSIAACEKVAGWAQAAADKLRGSDDRGTDRREELPSAEALLRLRDAALEYRGPRRAGGGGTEPPANGAVDIPAMRKMGEALNRPMPGAKRGVSAAAARGRSTTTKQGGKKPAPGNGTEQAGHLRRGSAEQPQARKPTQR